jgi:hypothetical protein
MALFLALFLTGSVFEMRGKDRRDTDSHPYLLTADG